MLIPFPPHRKREMAAYSKRHYGQYEWRLRDVKTIVEHLSVTSSVGAVYNTFAPDRPDSEFGELPNTCAHYVIGSSGRIYRLVPLTIRCRHVVGLNHVSVGIEHVGYTESDVLGNPRQLHASLRLTRWLRCRYHLKVPAVIGHNESLSSPYYRELDPRFRGQTHGDWRPPYMNRYRRMLRSLGPCPRA
jgi:N-acetyl-anhydromuramyl-L-alanine amidase AmpD